MRANEKLLRRGGEISLGPAPDSRGGADRPADSGGRTQCPQLVVATSPDSTGRRHFSARHVAGAAGFENEPPLPVSHEARAENLLEVGRGLQCGTSLWEPISVIECSLSGGGPSSRYGLDVVVSGGGRVGTQVHVLVKS